LPPRSDAACQSEAAAPLHFDAARKYPRSLGEGKHLLTAENHLDYFDGLAHAALGHTDAASSALRRAASGGDVCSAMTYYQGMALRELGENAAANRKLRNLLEFAAKQSQTKPRIDYFATSLPNFLLFEDDLDERNRVAGLFLMGLARFGLGEAAGAEKVFREVLALDVNHLGAQDQLRQMSATTCAPPEKVKSS
jgi:tetratricopeptide (TPR) repeat protein